MPALGEEQRAIIVEIAPTYIIVRVCGSGYRRQVFAARINLATRVELGAEGVLKFDRMPSGVAYFFGPLPLGAKPSPPDDPVSAMSVKSEQNYLPTRRRT
jgi:hypothetical protein